MSTFDQIIARWRELNRAIFEAARSLRNDMLRQNVSEEKAEAVARAFNENQLRYQRQQSEKALDIAQMIDDAQLTHAVGDCYQVISWDRLAVVLPPSCVRELRKCVPF